MQKVNLHEQHIGRAALFGCLAALSFALMSLLGKIIGDSASTTMILFARFAISLVLILPWLIQNPKKILYTSKFGTMFTRSLFTLLAFFCFFYALKFIPLANAILLNNSFPIFVPLVVWILRGPRTSYPVWIGIIIGFLGLGALLKPTTGFLQSASLIALSSGVLAAVAVVLIRRLTKTVPMTQILFYNFLFCSLLTALFLPFDWQHPNSKTLLLLAGIGLFGAAYQFFSTVAYAKAPVRITSPLMFLSIVFGLLADWLIWHQTLDLGSLLGMICVVLGGMITIYFGQKEMKRK
jgi:drug/metabolite transporter (DMT)-like permease